MNALDTRRSIDLETEISYHQEEAAYHWEQIQNHENLICAHQESLRYHTMEWERLGTLWEVTS